MPDVTSPAAMFAQQAAVERRLELSLGRRMREFLGRVESLAMSERLYLSPAAVTGEWGVLVDSVGADLRQSGRDPFEAHYVTEQLLASETPDLVYLAVTSVLEQWSAERQSDAWLRSELGAVLAFDGDAITAAGFWDRVADKATRGVISGLTTAQNWKHKVEALSRTSATGLQAAAALQVMRAERVLFKRWVTKRDGKVRLSHAATDKKTVRLNEAFIIEGYSLMHPGDVNAPPALTANCRCILVGVR